MRRAEALPTGRHGRSPAATAPLGRALARRRRAIRTIRARRARRRGLTALLVAGGAGLFVAGLLLGGQLALAGYAVALIGVSVAAYERRASRRADRLQRRQAHQDDHRAPIIPLHPTRRSVRR